MELTPDNQSSELNKAASVKKKSWLKPQAKVLDIHAGGSATPDVGTATGDTTS